MHLATSPQTDLLVFARARRADGSTRTGGRIGRTASGSSTGTATMTIRGPAGIHTGTDFVLATTP
jgi:Asp-tRNA(Asn)/Glu-tRNA(Gln) amidotransferase A subunit family amidase